MFEEELRSTLSTLPEQKLSKHILHFALNHGLLKEKDNVLEFDWRHLEVKEWQGMSVCKDYKHNDLREGNR